MIWTSNWPKNLQENITFHSLQVKKIVCNIIIFSYVLGLTGFLRTLTLRTLQPYLSIWNLFLVTFSYFFYIFLQKNVYQNTTGINDYLKKVIFRHFIDIYTFRLKMLILVKKLLLKLDTIIFILPLHVNNI